MKNSTLIKSLSAASASLLILMCCSSFAHDTNEVDEADGQDAGNCQSHLTKKAGVNLVSPQLVGRVMVGPSALAPRFHVAADGQVYIASVDSQGALVVTDETGQVLVRPIRGSTAKGGAASVIAFHWLTENGKTQLLFVDARGRVAVHNVKAKSTSIVTTKPADSQYFDLSDGWLIRNVYGFQRVRIMPTGRVVEELHVDFEGRLLTAVPYESQGRVMLAGITDSHLKVFDLDHPQRPVIERNIVGKHGRAKWTTKEGHDLLIVTNSSNGSSEAFAPFEANLNSSELSALVMADPTYAVSAAVNASGEVGEVGEAFKYRVKLRDGHSVAVWLDTKSGQRTLNVAENAAVTSPLSIANSMLSDEAVFDSIQLQDDRILLAVQTGTNGILVFEIGARSRPKP